MSTVHKMVKKALKSFNTFSKMFKRVFYHFLDTRCHMVKYEHEWVLSLTLNGFSRSFIIETVSPFCQIENSSPKMMRQAKNEIFHLQI